MMETKVPEINIDELMEMIRAEVKKRKERRGTPRQTVPHASNGSPSNFYANVDFPRICEVPKPEPLEIKTNYHINDFFKYHGRYFVRNVYRGVLKREPDSYGLQYFIDKLNSGKLTKTEVVGRLRYCREGRPKKVKIKGLFWAFLIQSSFKIPFLGYLFRIMAGIANLPMILRNLQVLEQHLFKQFEKQQNDLETFSGQMESFLYGKTDRTDLESLRFELSDALESKAAKSEIIELSDALESKAARSEIIELSDALESKAARSEIVELSDALESKAAKSEIVELSDALESKADKDDLKSFQKELEPINITIQEILRQTKDHKLNILDQQRRLMIFLEEARKRLPGPISADQIREMLNEEDQILNAMYVAFEDQFRGTREDIKERQRVYLPYIKEAHNEDNDAPVLDLGCGRGEWLEILKEEGYRARGVDLNSVMIEECKTRGLDAVRGDAVDFLRNLKNGSMDVITGFHIVEHLSFRKMLSFFDETLRILKPGGIAIFETPNPENILVGSCTFYTDPSHNKPIPPDMFTFLLEYRGFVSSEVVRLHPLNFLEYDKNDFLRNLVDRFNMGQDYAVIARKSI